MALLKFDNISVLDAALVDNVVQALTADLDARGVATLVVSGGRTPKGFFHLLSQQTLNWGEVTITLADERWVDADHEASNEPVSASANAASSSEGLAAPEQTVIDEEVDILDCEVFVEQRVESYETLHGFVHFRTPHFDISEASSMIIHTDPGVLDTTEQHSELINKNPRRWKK